MNDEQRVSEALAAIEAAADADALEAIRIAALGKQGWISAALKSLGAMPPEERAKAAPAIQAMRSQVADAIAAKKAALDAAELEARLASETLDLTLPAPEAPKGSVHPVSQVMDELAEIFADMGFAVATGPEIEDDWHNFTALNMPESHPARAMHDTFYFKPSPLQGRGLGEGDVSTSPDSPRPPAPSPEGEGERRMLLRTHTSPVQVRTMMSQGAPVRIIAPGRVYRSDSDATHTPMFHQVEGLVIDRGIHRAISNGRWRPSSRPSSSARISSCACGRATSRSPSLRSKSMSVSRWRMASVCSAAMATSRGTAGWNCSAAAWSTGG